MSQTREGQEGSPHGVSIGVAAAGNPSDPTVYSGVPASLLHGLREAGVSAEPLAADLSSATRVAQAVLAIRRPADLLDPRSALARRRFDVSVSPAMARMRSYALHLAIRRRHVDAMVQNGCEFEAPRRLEFVTYEDSTVVQAKRSYPWPHLDI